jgi:hypothetical protein
MSPSPNIALSIVEMPKTLRRGETGLFLVKTDAHNICRGGVGYRNNVNRWITVEWPEQKANDFGECRWQWTVPAESSTGVAEFRVAAEQEGESRMLIPATFCIEACEP